MKISQFPKSLSRKYLRLASTYRRFAERSKGFDFSLNALLECFNHESHGTKYAKNNGYVYGKWSRDITVQGWIEEIKLGNMCKAEFYTPCNKWFAKEALKNVPTTSWFPHIKQESRQ